MPQYKVKPEPDYSVPMPASAKKRKRYPSVTIPVSKEIIAALEVGGNVTVELKGKVVGLESRQSTDNDPWGNRDELRLELRVVDAYPAEGGDEPEEKEPSMKDAIDKGLGYSK
jgi:hypothetical protein